jgi:nucleotide-binding universal stress UspA family protein
MNTMNAKSSDNKVLACVDQSPYADVVSDYAAWAAQRMGAPLELLHVIDRHPEKGNSHDHSGAIGVNAQEKLLDELAAEDQAKALSAREAGRVFLNRLRLRALDAGATDVDMRQRYGALDDTLAEQEAGVRLIVLGRRGASADASPRDLGRNVERTVRALHKPILTVTDRFKLPQRVMIAFDGGTMARKGVEMVAGSPLFRGLPIHLLMTGAPSADGPRQMAWARSHLHAVGFEVFTVIEPGDTESTVARAIGTHGIDVLVMGAYSHSPLRSWLRGSKTTDLLRAARIPTLLLR